MTLTDILTLLMTFAQVVKTSLNVITNSPSQDYTHPDDHTSLTYDMTPGFKPFTDQNYLPGNFQVIYLLKYYYMLFTYWIIIYYIIIYLFLATTSTV